MDRRNQFVVQAPQSLGFPRARSRGSANAEQSVARKERWKLALATCETLASGILVSPRLHHSHSKTTCSASLLSGPSTPFCSIRFTSFVLCPLSPLLFPLLSLFRLRPTSLEDNSFIRVRVIQLFPAAYTSISFCMPTALLRASIHYQPLARDPRAHHQSLFTSLLTLRRRL